jgi:hypothetical protein
VKKSVNAAIEEIIKLRARYSERDLKDAINYLAKSESLDEYGSAIHTKQVTKPPKSSGRTRKDPEISKVVSDLKDIDQERFELLSRFDKALRNKEIMKSLDSIRDVGSAIDKTFDPGKSRKGAITKFMKLLASLSVDEARKQINSILEAEHDSHDEDEAYSKLAAFLIGGRD